MTLTESKFNTLAGDLSSAIAKLKVNSSAKEVHRLRTSTRRMESFFAYLHPQMTRKQKAALEELSALRKRAGKVRDLDVQMQLLKQGISNGSVSMDRRSLTQAMQEKRHRQVKRAAAAARKIERSRLFLQLQSLEEQALAQPDSFGDDSTPLRQAETELTALAAEFCQHSADALTDMPHLTVYLFATVVTALSWNIASYVLFRFLTGAGIGGEYIAINSTI